MTTISSELSVETLPTLGKVLELMPGEGRRLWVLGDMVTIKLTGEQTGGLLAVYKNTVPLQGGAPLHTHQREDKVYFVQEGELAFLCGDRASRVGPGAVLYVPRGTLHTFKNVGTVPARFLTLITPAGFEKIFDDLGTPVTDPATPPAVTPADWKKLQSLAPSYGLEIHLPTAPGR